MKELELEIQSPHSPLQVCQELFRRTYEGNRALIPASRSSWEGGLAYVLLSEVEENKLELGVALLMYEKKGEAHVYRIELSSTDARFWVQEFLYKIFGEERVDLGGLGSAMVDLFLVLFSHRKDIRELLEKLRKKNVRVSTNWELCLRAADEILDVLLYPPKKEKMEEVLGELFE